MRHVKNAFLLTLVYCLASWLIYDNPGDRARLTMDAENLLGNNLYAITVGIQLIIKYLILTGLYFGVLTLIVIIAITEKKDEDEAKT